MKNKKLLKVNIKTSIWVIGDIHGKFNKLKKLLKEIPKGDTICFVGDLIDRGEDSRKVIKLIKDKKYYCVKGNHEEVMIDSIKDNNMESFQFWVRIGGYSTIRNYIKIDKNHYRRPDILLEKVRLNKSIKSDVKWLSKLPIIIKFNFKKKKPLYVSHAGIKLFRNDSDIKKNNSENYILWNKYTQEKVGFAVNIHGHTIISKEKMKISKSQIDVDTGAFLNKKNGKGFLTAIQYPSLKTIHIK